MSTILAPDPAVALSDHKFPVAENVSRPKVSVFFLAAVVTLVPRLYLLVMNPSFALEDALITFRHVMNFVHGHGLLYNVGHPSLGTTSPLWALMLSASVWVHNDILIDAKILAIAIDLFTVSTILKTLWPHSRSLAIGMVCLFASYPSATFLPQTGMETSLYVLLLWASWMAVDQKRWVLLGIVLGLSVWCRPDALILVFVSAIFVAMDAGRRRTASVLGIAVLTVAPWIIYATAYYGSPIPSSMIGKMHTYGSMFHYFQNIGSVFHSVVLGPALHRLLLVPFVVITGIHLLRSFRAPRYIAVPFVWLVADLAAFSIAKTSLFEWYLYPMHIAYIYLALVGLLISIRSFLPLTEWLRDRFRSKGFAYACAAVMLLICISMQVPLNSYMRHRQQEEDEIRKKIALDLRQQAPAGSTLMLEPIGYIGFYSGLPIIDLIGLVSPEIRSIPEVYPANIFELSKRYFPAYVVLRQWELEYGNNRNILKDYQLMEQRGQYLVLKRRGISEVNR